MPATCWATCWTVANLLNNSGSGNLIPIANLLNHILSLL